MHTFFVTDLNNAQVPLSEEEAGHALRVLRLAEGERILLVDGKGTRAEAELRLDGKRDASAIVHSRIHIERERKAVIHLAVSPTKNIDRFEWLLEKATEIGVDRITPLMTARTERDRLRTDRLDKILIAAMKQSQRSWLPILDKPLPLSAVQALPAVQRLFGWCEGDRTTLQEAYAPAREVLILIGPEGDFAPEEAAGLVATGFLPVSLGEARLRTETAAIAAITWMNFAQQR